MPQEYTKLYEPRLARSIAEKRQDFQSNGRLKHLIYSNQFSKETLSRLIRLALKIEKIDGDLEASKALANVLYGKRVVLYFTQPSTRTFGSFAAAAQILGVSIIDFREESLSSSVKGEHVLDTIRMFGTYSNAIILRTHLPKLAEVSAYLMKDTTSRDVSIVNAGSGADEHPTQALLDIFTIERSFSFTDPGFSRAGKDYNYFRKLAPTLRPGIDGKHYVFYGDLGRGRTVHSIVSLLALYPEVKLTFVSEDHPDLKMPQPLKDSLSRMNVDFHEETNIEDVLPFADALYVTRRQTEHVNDTINKLPPQRTISSEECALMPEHSIIMHPLPRNEELSRDADQDHRQVYFEQATNGMWIRAALLCYLFDAEALVDQVYEKYGFIDFKHIVEV